MSFYTKDLDAIPCRCAATNDALWFWLHQDRAKYLRVAFECEEAKDLGAEVKQVVAVWMARPLKDLIESREPLTEVVVHRRSFLFLGKAVVDYSTDAKVDQFLALIDDGSGQMSSVSVN